MTRRTVLWWTLTPLFLAVNVGGAAIAAAGSEWFHSGIHQGLVLVGAYLALRLAPRSRDTASPGIPPADDRLERLQRSVDLIALEVERIGEAERFVARLQQERRASQPR